CGRHNGEPNDGLPQHQNDARNHVYPDAKSHSARRHGCCRHRSEYASKSGSLFDLHIIPIPGAEVKKMNKDRREFLRNSCYALSMTALATQMRHFGMMSVQAQTRIDEQDDIVAVSSDYRALVCMFLSGGNDGNNTVIPNHNDATISNYS